MLCKNSFFEIVIIRNSITAVIPELQKIIFELTDCLDALDSFMNSQTRLYVSFLKHSIGVIHKVDDALAQADQRRMNKTL